MKVEGTFRYRKKKEGERRKQLTYVAFRLACHSPHCHFDDDICTTAQVTLAAEG